MECRRKGIRAQSQHREDKHSAQPQRRNRGWGQVWGPGRACGGEHSQVAKAAGRGRAAGLGTRFVGTQAGKKLKGARPGSNHGYSARRDNSFNLQKSPSLERILARQPHRPLFCSRTTQHINNMFETACRHRQLIVRAASLTKALISAHTTILHASDTAELVAWVASHLFL